MKVAIDGPAASGKSTTAKLIADQFGFTYIDSGAMYRAVTYTWLQKTKGQRSEADETLLAEIVQAISLDFIDNGKKILINGEDLNTEIRSSEVSQNVSYIASFATVRTRLVERQRELAESQNVIMDGRDIGTVVFPDAELKIFLNASAETRALRRKQDLEALGEKPELEKLIKEIEERDKLDSERKIAPLTKAKDAIEIITDNKTVDAVAQLIIAEIQKFIAV